MRKGTLVLMVLCALSFISSCKEIRNLLKAIDKYGYKSKIPLGEKNVPISQLIIGSFVYKGLPIIISEKDDYTYKLKFLTTELDENDIEIEAFLTVIGTSNYLNLDLGYSFSFLKISDVSIIRDVEVKLIKNTIQPYVTEKKLAAWLLKHDGEDEFMTEDSTSIDIFYTFNFSRITEERAYQMKAEQLQEKKELLFKSCADYEMYATLSAKYPGDAALVLAREALLDKCTTIDDYKAFVAYFANDVLSEKANKIITEKTLYIKDSLAYYNLKASEDVNEYLQFIDNCATPLFKDSAIMLLTPLLNNITEDKIEWKWNGGEKAEAIKLIFYKIEYTPKHLNINWYREHLTSYCLRTSQTDLKQKALLYLDKLAMGNTTKDELLDLYMSKGFILWSLGMFEEALDVFKSKINESYLYKENATFKKTISTNYKAYQKAGIIFPDEKNVWKRIKKLK